MALWVGSWYVVMMAQWVCSWNVVMMAQCHNDGTWLGWRYVVLMAQWVGIWYLSWGRFGLGLDFGVLLWVGVLWTNTKHTTMRVQHAITQLKTKWFTLVYWYTRFQIKALYSYNRDSQIKVLQNCIPQILNLNLNTDRFIHFHLMIKVIHFFFIIVN